MNTTSAGFTNNNITVTSTSVKKQGQSSSSFAKLIKEIMTDTMKN